VEAFGKTTYKTLDISNDNVTELCVTSADIWYWASIVNMLDDDDDDELMLRGTE